MKKSIFIQALEKLLPDFSVKRMPGWWGYCRVTREDFACEFESKPLRGWPWNRAKKEWLAQNCAECVLKIYARHIGTTQQS